MGAGFWKERGMTEEKELSLSEQKRKQIIEAAVAEFQERGFAGASMDRISGRAGVSKRTVYNHFDSKEALFRAITDCLVSWMTAALNVTFRPDLPVAGQLEALGWAEGELLVNPCFLRMARMIFGEAFRDPALSAEVAARMDKFRVFESFMQDAFAAGALQRGTPEVAAAQFLGLLKSRGFYPYFFSGSAVGREEMGTIISETVELLLRAYGPVSGLRA